MESIGELPIAPFCGLGLEAWPGKDVLGFLRLSWESKFK
jgi:hypothetical protein